MIIRNGNVFLQGRGFVKTSVGAEGDRIRLSGGSGGCIDAAGKYVLPGLVDIHMHGAAGADFCDGTRASLEAIARYEASEGVTSFLGTGMAQEEEVLLQAHRAARDFIEHPAAGCAAMRGINMEGPFLSKEKKGAHVEKCCIPWDAAMFERLDEASGGSVRIIDMCPEYEGNLEAIAQLSKRMTVSLAHTTANYDLSKKAFAAGASHVTHLFNAMMPYGHRDPGLVGAAIEDAAEVEMICDGIHLHPSVIRTMFRLFAPDARLCMISDSMRAAGMPNGDYELGGQKVLVRDGRATLENGTLAGAAVCLAEALRRVVSFGVPLEQAAEAATHTPARSVCLDDEVGSIADGLRADFLILNDDLSTYAVVLGGEQIR